MDNFYMLLLVAFSCGMLFKAGDTVADLIIVIIKYLFILVKRKIRK
jgi:hypothetical protein